jgi:translocation and assembly module TamB
MKVDGRIAAQSREGGTRVQAQLRARAAPAHPPFSLDAALRIDADRIALDEGRLRLDGGYAQLTGALARGNTQAFSVGGTLRDLNPGLLVKGADARLNGELRAEGVLRPAPRATLRASLTDSALLGRPLRGRIDARWLGDDGLQIEADLAVRSAELAVRGGLGTDAGGSVRNLEIALNAPAVEELGLPLRGAVAARATLAGVWRAPAIDASVTASRLVYAGQRIGRLAGRLHYAGGGDGALDLAVELDDHRHPRGAPLSVAQARLNAGGTLGEHRLTIAARTGDGVPLALAAVGGWHGDAQTGAWRGRVESATAGGAFDVTLAAPTELAIAADGGHIGPARLRVHGAAVTDARLQWRDAGSGLAFESSGAFADLALAATAGAGETPLTLQGTWRLRAAGTLDGHVLIERSGGDVHTGTTARRTKMGLTEMRVEAQVRANRLIARAVARGSEVGAVTAALRAEIEAGDDGWRLAAQRAWNGELEASVPSLAWINPFLSANLRESIRVGGSVQASLRLAGTPAAPRASGFVNADALRVAWIEQGVRLDNGVVRARLAADAGGATEIVFDSVSFSGAPRFVPDDRRVRTALGAQPSGRLDATGRVKLPEMEGVVQLQFARFPLVQRRDRWAVGTGGANMVFSPKRVRLDGALVADAGYIDIARPAVPSLSDDVIVVRATDGPEARRPAAEPRVAFDFDFGIDLGPAFFLSGSGVDTRLAGALRVRHEGRGVIRATGTVEARDGTYEGYGQKLVIERGRINFQGPIDNPGLDILALRKGLPVEVGVTITRTAANPLVRLYSDPPQADFETLSWLVLGRPAEASRGDNVALARAAVGLLGGSGEGVPTQLARRLGIDEFSIRTADASGSGSLLPRQSVAGRVRGDPTTLGGEIVTIGKRLSDDLTLSYEQATTGTSNVVQLSYRLTQRLSVIARAGTENALDLVYSFAFD